MLMQLRREDGAREGRRGTHKVCRLVRLPSDAGNVASGFVNVTWFRVDPGPLRAGRAGSARVWENGPHLTKDNGQLRYGVRLMCGLEVKDTKFWRVVVR